jgi:uncharacterized membrane protein (DUF485 family)
MAIKREELTDEQYKALTKLYWRYRGKIALTVLLYVGFLFLANFAAILVDTLYVHNSTFRFLMAIGSAVIAMQGLRGTVEEQQEVFTAKVKEIVGHL